jgi:hypothetical protein
MITITTTRSMEAQLCRETNHRPGLRTDIHICCGKRKDVSLTMNEDSESASKCRVSYTVCPTMDSVQETDEN